MKKLSLVFAFLYFYSSTFSVFAQSMPIGSRSLIQKMLSGQGNGSDQKNGQGQKGKTAGGSKTSMGAGGEGSSLDYQIHLLGQVESPGTYRLSPTTRLDEAISKAGGITDMGSRRYIEVRRDNRTLYYDLFKFQKFADLNQNPFLLDNDVVYVPYTKNNVAIYGPVKGGGMYELGVQDKSLADLIKMGGGFTVGISQQAPITVVRYINGKKQLYKVAPVNLEMQQFSLLDGDVVIVPHIFSENKRFDYNIPELPADNIYYPTQKNEIFISGAVSQGGAQPYNPTYSVRDFIVAAGPTESANIRATYALTSDGKYVRSVLKKKNFNLSPGDSLFVPSRHFTTDNVLKWYNTIISTVFTGVAFKSLLEN